MKLIFKEASLGSSFCKDRVRKLKELIRSSTSFTVVGMPAMGISIFLRFLATRNFANFYHIDIYELPAVNKVELLKLILRELGGKISSGSFQETIELCKQRLKFLTQKHKRVVLIFNRFDQLKREFDRSFFGNLRALRDVDKERIVMIFSANKPLHEIAPAALAGGNLNMYSKTFYLKPYSPTDLKKLLNVNAPTLKSGEIAFKKALMFSGGHYQLFQLLIRSERLENPLSDPFVKAQLNELYTYLNYFQRRQLQKIALGKKSKAPDQYLLNTGMVIKHQGGYQLFTPLFSEFIRLTLSFRLPAKEAKLFQLLKKNFGKVVSKDQIFETLWEGNIDRTSDWALNALIYRLRNHPAFTRSGYLIENHKKLGYALIRI